MLLVLLVSLCVTTVVIGQNPPSPCCTTDKWQGFYHLPGGFYVQNMDIAGYSDVGMGFFYDYTEKKFAIEQHIIAPDAQFETRIKDIWNYNQGQMKSYSIDNDGTCTYHTLTGSMNKLCIPNDAVYHHHRYFGGPHHNLETDEWIVDAGTLQLNITVTSRDCAPFLVRVFGTIQESGVDVITVGEGHFVNITHTIHDDKVFDPPADCQPGKVQSIQPQFLKHYLKAAMGLE